MNRTTTYSLRHPRPAMGGYRYSFNGQEADNEVLGEGALHAFEYRLHDTRIGRFWSVDPLAGKFPWNSPYAFAENRVVDGSELEGLEWAPNKPLHTTQENISIRIVSANDIDCNEKRESLSNKIIIFNFTKVCAKIITIY